MAVNALSSSDRGGRSRNDRSRPRAGSRPRSFGTPKLETEMSDATDRPLPLDGWHRARGARMVSFAGYQLPIQYEGIIAEHLWTRDSAGLFDVSQMGQLIIAGAE